jgi:hypothetical protein
MPTYRIKYDELSGAGVDIEATSEAEAIVILEMRTMLDFMSRAFGEEYTNTTFERLHAILTDETGAQQKRLAEAIE